MDLLPDYNRQRLYITNSGLNRIEVFDMKTQNSSRLSPPDSCLTIWLSGPTAIPFM